MSSSQQEAEKEHPTSISAELFSSVPASSREQMMEHGTRFVQFVHSKNSCVNLRTTDERAVNEYLRFFYFTLKTKQGHQYSPSSLICIRAGIQRYFDLVLGRRLILPGNPVFMTSNRMLGQRAKDYANSSGNSVRHYAPMLPRDRQLMDEYFNGGSPGAQSMEERLQDWVLFTLFYHFGCAPQQHQQSQDQQQHQQQLIRRDALVFSVDQEGREFVSLLVQNEDPNKAGRANSGAVRMYTDLDRLKAYLCQLPVVTMDNSLFPRPLRGGRGYSTNINRGLNYMQNFMRNVSRKARLSRFYSNHCIRLQPPSPPESLTRIRDLDQSGFSADEIRSVTGHKCEKSVKRCLRRGANSDGDSSSAASAAATSADTDESADVPFVVMDYQSDNESADVE